MKKPLELSLKQRSQTSLQLTQNLKLLAQNCLPQSLSCLLLTQSLRLLVQMNSQKLLKNWPHLQSWTLPEQRSLPQSLNYLPRWRKKWRYWPQRRQWWRQKRPCWRRYWPQWRYWLRLSSQQRP